MKFNTLLFFTAIVTSAKADDGYMPGDNYSTFTPTEGYLDNATTQFNSPFGIAINPLTSSVMLSSVTTKSDGKVLITQIGDGQIQATTETPTPTIETIAVVTQIGDGQIQATTLTTKIRPTSSTTSSIIPVSSSTFDDTTEIFTTKITKVIKQFVTVAYTPETTSSSIETTSLAIETTSSAIETTSSSIETTSSSVETTSSTIETTSSTSDDVTTTYYVTPTETIVDTVTSLTLPTLAPTTVVLKRSLTEETAKIIFDKRDLPISCSSETVLSMTLEDSVLRDGHGRIGAIVSNRQFQFDGPPPQSGSIYAAGWSIVDGKLALGKSTVFYQCLSGNFYNLYDTSIGPQCTAVELDVVLFTDC